MAGRELTRLTLSVLGDVTPETWFGWMQRIGEKGPGELKKISDSKYFAFSALQFWIEADPNRKADYEAALRAYAESLAAECIAISDTQEIGVEKTTDADGGVKTVEGDMLGHRKLKIDTRMKLASKWNRERYGESVKVEQAPQVVLNLSFGGEQPVIEGEAA